MKKIVVLLTLIVNSSLALAYIDPGTGGLIAGSVWPVIVGVFTAIGGFCVRYFFKPIKGLFLKVWKKEEKQN